MKRTIRNLARDFKRTPRTASIALAWVLFLVGMCVWIWVTDGFWWMVFVIGTATAIVAGLSWLSRWAAKGDGIDQ